MTSLPLPPPTYLLLMHVSFVCRPSVTEPVTSGTFPTSSWCHFALLFNVSGREILEACRCHVDINVRRPAISFLRFAVTMATKHSEKAEGAEEVMGVISSAYQLYCLNIDFVLFTCTEHVALNRLWPELDTILIYKCA